MSDTPNLGLKIWERIAVRPGCLQIGMQSAGIEATRYASGRFPLLAALRRHWNHSAGFADSNEELCYAWHARKRGRRGAQVSTLAFGVTEAAVQHLRATPDATGEEAVQLLESTTTPVPGHSDKATEHMTGEVARVGYSIPLERDRADLSIVVSARPEADRLDSALTFATPLIEVSGELLSNPLSGSSSPVRQALRQADAVEPSEATRHRRGHAETGGVARNSPADLGHGTDTSDAAHDAAGQEKLARIEVQGRENRPGRALRQRSGTREGDMERAPIMMPQRLAAMHLIDEQYETEPQFSDRDAASEPLGLSGSAAPDVIEPRSTDSNEDGASSPAAHSMSEMLQARPDCLSANTETDLSLRLGVGLPRAVAVRNASSRQMVRVSHQEPAELVPPARSSATPIVTLGDEPKPASVFSGRNRPEVTPHVQDAATSSTGPASAALIASRPLQHLSQVVRPESAIQHSRALVSSLERSAKLSTLTITHEHRASARYSTVAADVAQPRVISVYPESAAPRSLHTLDEPADVVRHESDIQHARSLVTALDSTPNVSASATNAGQDALDTYRTVTVEGTAGPTTFLAPVHGAPTPIVMYSPRDVVTPLKRIPVAGTRSTEAEQTTNATYDTPNDAVTSPDPMRAVTSPEAPIIHSPVRSAAIASDRPTDPPQWKQFDSVRAARDIAIGTTALGPLAHRVTNSVSVEPNEEPPTLHDGIVNPPDRRETSGAAVTERATVVVGPWRAPEQPFEYELLDRRVTATRSREHTGSAHLPEHAPSTAVLRAPLLTTFRDVPTRTQGSAHDAPPECPHWTSPRSKPLDVASLADQIYRLIVSRLARERESRGG